MNLKFYNEKEEVEDVYVLLPVIKLLKVNAETSHFKESKGNCKLTIEVRHQFSY